MEQTYYEYNPWWEGDVYYGELVERPEILSLLEQHLGSKSIIILTGLRRVGKTSLLRLLIHKLIARGIQSERIFYVSLDDYVLNEKSIIDIIDDYRKIHRLTRDTEVYLFLDEITYKDDFQQQLKNIHDSQNARVFASSSSASVLHDRKAFLTGRELTFEILPLDFNEYLLFKKIKIMKRDEKLKDSYFKEYLETGGMPEYVLNPRREYLQALIDDIIYKDIIAFHNIKSHQAVKDFFMLLMERAGKQLSINKVANILKISPDTSKRYLSFFEDSYLVHSIPRYGKTNEAILAPKKVYAPDTGIRNFITGFRDIESVFENYLYLKIKTQGPRYIYSNGVEIDFYCSEKDLLLEAKYGPAMKEKQQKLFDSFKAKRKIIVSDYRDIESVESIISGNENN